eukprot:TRINITY_DN12909_c0_g1_i2.p1 TRINITY_DN12909_c0_g1~~TRINITY_DN12909_c0_g1_i2.p1  ORF type:complete len:466 (+),score=73.01 TRINITY_DN12909_c0_g1_i2:36-1433(+)
MSKKQVASYILDKHIGAGAYAAVWKAHVQGTTKAVSIKIVNRRSQSEVRQMMDEVAVLHKVSHLNVVCYLDLAKTARHFYLVLEHCSGGNLGQFLYNHGRVPEETARRFLADIAAGLRALHHAGALHLDLRPSNILLSKDDGGGAVLKLANVGLSRTLRALGDSAAAVVTRRSHGPPVYSAPEVLCEGAYDTRADIWSAGVVLHEMLLGRTPFAGATSEQLLLRMQKANGGGGFRFEDMLVSDRARELLRALLAWSPEKRLSSQDLAQHAYVRIGISADQYTAGSAVGLLVRTFQPWAGDFGVLFREAARAVAFAAARATAAAATGAFGGASAALNLASRAVGNESSRATVTQEHALQQTPSWPAAQAVTLSPLTASSLALVFLRMRASCVAESFRGSPFLATLGAAGPAGPASARASTRLRWPAALRAASKPRASASAGVTAELIAPSQESALDEPLLPLATSA